MRTLLCALAFLATTVSVHAKPDKIYQEISSDRFCEMIPYDLSAADSIRFTTSFIKIYSHDSAGKVTTKSFAYNDKIEYSFGPYRRAIAKPAAYNDVNFNSSLGRFSFERSRESEHFIIFWEKGLELVGNTITLDGNTVNVNTLLSNAEKIWDKYVNDLGFLVPGQSTTDKLKIEMFIVNQTDWRADGSGSEATMHTISSNAVKDVTTKVGLFHCNPAAANARGGHTLAHEIGHTFQYLVSADLGVTHGLNYVLGTNSSGNEWWEDCANWQAYKMYPQMQFSDGEYYEGYIRRHHLNIHHEAARYNNCFYHDWWCQQHGQNTIGRVWRESIKPEDPTQAYMRIFGYNTETFADDQYQCYAHFTSIDIDGVRDYGKAKIGSEPNRLMEPSAEILSSYLGNDKSYWVVDPAFCVQNYGYNANPLRVPAAGTVIKASFKGIVGAPGYRNINPAYAGWRYGIAAYCTDGKRYYSEMGKDKEGEITFTVPQNCKYMWFVVMGAPTTYWTHSWNDNDADDEQWPYAVSFTNTDPLGALRHYDEFPADYQRKSVEIVQECNLTYSATGYTSVDLQYDMNAISEALGLSTEQLKTVKRNDTSSNPGDIRFAGLSSNGVYNYNTTTSTSSDELYGHWFTTTGNVCGYDGSAAVYAEMNPKTYVCKIGQYPGRLTPGRTYTFRQVIAYTHTDGKIYRATIKVNLNIK